MAHPKIADLTFASARIDGDGVVSVHYARCEPCMVGAHFAEPTPHDWADEDDIAHALATGQESPAGKSCACFCVTEGDSDAGQPDLVDVDLDESLDLEPCDVCGEPGACGFDSEGRPLIHTTPIERGA